MTIMHKLQINLAQSNTLTINERATITVGATAESAWPQSLQEEEGRNEWPKLIIISDPTAENKKRMAQICAYRECSE